MITLITISITANIIFAYFFIKKQKEVISLNKRRDHYKKQYREIRELYFAEVAESKSRKQTAFEAA